MILEPHVHTLREQSYDRMPSRQALLVSQAGLSASGSACLLGRSLARLLQALARWLACWIADFACLLALLLALLGCLSASLLACSRMYLCLGHMFETINKVLDLDLGALDLLSGS